MAYQHCARKATAVCPVPTFPAAETYQMNSDQKSRHNCVRPGTLSLSVQTNSAAVRVDVLIGGVFRRKPRRTLPPRRLFKTGIQFHPAIMQDTLADSARRLLLLMRPVHLVVQS